MDRLHELRKGLFSAQYWATYLIRVRNWSWNKSNWGCFICPNNNPRQILLENSMKHTDSDLPFKFVYSESFSDNERDNHQSSNQLIFQFRKHLRMCMYISFSCAFCFAKFARWLSKNMALVGFFCFTCSALEAWRQLSWIWYERDLHPLESQCPGLKIWSGLQRAWTTEANRWKDETTDRTRI